MISALELRFQLQGVVLALPLLFSAQNAGGDALTVNRGIIGGFWPSQSPAPSVNPIIAALACFMNKYTGIRNRPLSPQIWQRRLKHCWGTQW